MKTRPTSADATSKPASKVSISTDEFKGYRFIWFVLLIVTANIIIAILFK